MKRKILVCVVCTGAIALILHLVWRPAFTGSASPDGMYRVQVYARRGHQLLNAPEYLTIIIRKTSSSQKATIYTEIHNDDYDLHPEHNIHMVWEPNKLVIVLQGFEQRPEIIEVSLEDGLPYEQHQYDIPHEATDAVLVKYGIERLVEYVR